MNCKFTGVSTLSSWLIFQVHLHSRTYPTFHRNHRLCSLPHLQSITVFFIYRISSYLSVSQRSPTHSSCNFWPDRKSAFLPFLLSALFLWEWTGISLSWEHNCNQLVIDCFISLQYFIADSLQWILPSGEWDSILEAVFTVSPKRQYLQHFKSINSLFYRNLGILAPTTPATTGPEWIPALIAKGVFWMGSHTVVASKSIPNARWQMISQWFSQSYSMLRLLIGLWVPYLRNASNWHVRVSHRLHFICLNEYCRLWIMDWSHLLKNDESIKLREEFIQEEYNIFRWAVGNNRLEVRHIREHYRSTIVFSWIR